MELNKSQLMLNFIARFLVIVIITSVTGVFDLSTSHAESPEQNSGIDFDRDIQPILTRYGCNSGACHGKQRGQNGFQLSLLGFDSDFDYDALVNDSRGRRITPARPDESLFLAKPAATLPHGGGKIFSENDAAYQILREWIVSGMPRSIPGTPDLLRVEVNPTQTRFLENRSESLQVTAFYSDGSKRDVTDFATYQSNESPIAAVDEHGVVTVGNLTGEAAIMARYSGHFAVFTASIPLPEPIAESEYSSLPINNEIDRLIWGKLKTLNVRPSEAAEEHKFLRRAYIDIVGRLPTAQEASSYLNDTAPGKENALVDHLLADPEYAEHWANKWADLLRPNPYRVGIKATMSFDTWIRDAFRRNQPYDEFVTELITAQGGTFRNGSVTLFRDRRSPDELTTIVSQLFLGVRLECAKCHHHPFEVYGQEDFYSFAAYFARLGRKGTGVSPPISGSEEFIYVSDKGEVKHPLTNEVLDPKPLYGSAETIEVGQDPRVVLAAWMTSSENRKFAQTMANRVWADLMGNGLVEPVDDLRATNPASNPELLDHLGEYFVEHNFDLKELIRYIMSSHVYRLSSQPNPTNAFDTRYYSRRYRTRLRAEVMLDSVCQITGVPESYSAMAPESRAKELWTHRISSLFLDAFARPDPNQDPPCERIPDSTVIQTLHMMNSENLSKKISADIGFVKQLSESEKSPEELIDQLYLSVYSRYPDSGEKLQGLEYLNQSSENRRKLIEDYLWALLNTPEFVYKD